jgi:hypothetical protein
MDVFAFRDELVTANERFTRSFVRMRLRVPANLIPVVGQTRISSGRSTRKMGCGAATAVGCSSRAMALDRLSDRLGQLVARLSGLSYRHQRSTGCPRTHDTRCDQT